MIGTARPSSRNRGTNTDFSLSDPLDSPIVRDMWNGWAVGAGYDTAGQGGLAIEFYESVLSGIANHDLDIFDINNAHITLTGHSLGGGLAGLVSALSGKSALIFDHMPFGVAAQAAALSEAVQRALVHFGLETDTPQRTYEEIMAGTHPAIEAGDLTKQLFAYRVDQELGGLAYDHRRPRAYHVEGEFLTNIRNGNVQIGIAASLDIALTLLLRFNLPESPFQGLYDLGEDTGVLDAGVQNTPIDIRGIDATGGSAMPWAQSVGAHSQALQTMLLFGEKQWSSERPGDDGWQDTLQYVFPAIDDELAREGFGLAKDLTGAASGGDQLASMIAYSLIDDGTRVFGDTGIRALFDDADDLGKAQDRLPGFITDDVKHAMGGIVAEFAGLLASNKVLAEDWETATKGILAYGSDSIGQSLSIDLTDDTWSLDQTLSEAHDRVSTEGFVQEIFSAAVAEILSGNNRDFVRNELIAFLNAHLSEGSTDVYDDIDFVTISLTDNVLFKSDFSKKRQLLVGSDAVEDVVLSNLGDSSAVVLGGGGADIIRGTSKDDALLGGKGGDTLIGGAGSDWFYGGSGQDYIFGDDEDGSNGAGFIDTVVYADPGTLTLRYDGTEPQSTVYVNGNGEKDTLKGIEEIKVLANLARFDLVGTLAADTNLIIESVGSGQVSGAVAQIIDGAGLDHGISVSLNRSEGFSQLANRDNGGVILLSGFNTEIVGSNYDDWISDGSDEEKKISGLGGNDEISVEGTQAAAELIGGQGNDILRGGDGDDVIDGASDDDRGSLDQLWGGSGADIFLTNDGDVIHDPDRGDRVKLDGKLLTGGIETAPGSGVYKCSDGTTYTLDGNTLTVETSGLLGSSIILNNFTNGFAGIRLKRKEEEPDADDAEDLSDPLIIDFNADRNVLTARSATTAYFDLDNDGFAERVTWSQAGDGFLVRDLDGNGRIDNGAEMFGTGHTDLDGGLERLFGEEGFAELAWLDTDSDGSITAGDAQFDTLRVWMDANGDAFTDEGELRTLAELGIVSIGLTRDVADHVAIVDDSSQVTRSSTVLFADGSSRTIYDAYLSVDQYDAREVLDPALDLSGVADLPNILGSGTVYDLDVAMSRDPALEEMVRELAALPASEAHQILGRVEQILLRWTGADQVATDARGVNINAQWLAAIEQFTGKAFTQGLWIGENPRGDAATILIAEWREIIASTAAKLVGQSAAADLAPQCRILTILYPGDYASSDWDRKAINDNLDIGAAA